MLHRFVFEKNQHWSITTVRRWQMGEAMGERERGGGGKAAEG